MQQAQPADIVRGIDGNYHPVPYDTNQALAAAPRLLGRYTIGRESAASFS